jgi:hypothetical protein
MNRRDSYHLDNQNKQTENAVTDHVLHNNGYSISQTHTTSTSQAIPKPLQPNTKWARLTYICRETRFITKVFRNTPVRIAYTTRNTIQQLLSIPTTPSNDKYNKSGIYQLTCPDCSKKYTGQTDRTFSTRFHIHFRDYTQGHTKSISPMNTIMKPLFSRLNVG